MMSCYKEKVQDKTVVDPEHQLPYHEATAASTFNTLVVQLGPITSFLHHFHERKPYGEETRDARHLRRMGHP